MVKGMTVTDIVREEFLYRSNHWITDDDEDYRKTEEQKRSETIEKIERYNKSSSRFLFYPWGVWVTAYARRNLFSGILECAGDYVYSDTDSIKILNADRHMAYIKKYNEAIIQQLKNACDFHKISYDLICPKTISGKEKPLGIWEFEGKYHRFKTLGAKRYMYEDDNGLHITVSGLNKKTAIWELCERWKSDLKTHTQNFNPFNRFSNQLEISPERTGKLTHTYIDTPLSGEITDYLGNKGTFNERSVIHLKPGDYCLSVSQKYLDYILQKEEE